RPRSQWRGPRGNRTRFPLGAARARARRVRPPEVETVRGLEDDGKEPGGPYHAAAAGRRGASGLREIERLAEFRREGLLGEGLGKEHGPAFRAELRRHVGRVA